MISLPIYRPNEDLLQHPTQSICMREATLCSRVFTSSLYWFSSFFSFTILPKGTDVLRVCLGHVTIRNKMHLYGKKMFLYLVHTDQ